MVLTVSKAASAPAAFLPVAVWRSGGSVMRESRINSWRTPLTVESLTPTRRACSRSERAGSAFSEETGRTTIFSRSQPIVMNATF